MVRRWKLASDRYGEAGPLGPKVPGRGVEGGPGLQQLAVAAEEIREVTEGLLGIYILRDDAARLGRGLFHDSQGVLHVLHPGGRRRPVSLEEVGEAGREAGELLSSKEEESLEQLLSRSAGELSEVSPEASEPGFGLLRRPERR